LLHVVHRDVSPHNVIVAYAGHAKVLDFGVAKFEIDAGSARTRTGEVKGKMAYMSPEQALGETLDRRADLFGVGAVLFECLAGQRMWGQGTDLEVMRKLALEEPPRLDAIARDVPKALVELYARLVARDPAARPRTAREVADALRAVAPGSTVDGARALLSRLFPGEEAAKTKRLTDGLAHTEPGRAPTSGAPAWERDGTRVDTQGARRTKARPWAGAIGIALVGMVVGVAVRATGGARASDGVSESAGVSAGANAGAGASARANEELLVHAGAATERSEGASRATVSVSGAAAEVGAVARPRKAAGPAAQVKGSQATRPPDVDPSPF
jgi:serine/threonine-protein kinase